MKNNQHHITLGRSGDQTVDTRSTFGVPLKTYRKNGLNWLLGRSVASKLSLQQADELFYQSEMEIHEKLKTFTFRPPARKRIEISGCVQQVKLSSLIGQQLLC